jgi:hypothetical protein
MLPLMAFIALGGIAADGLAQSQITPLFSVQPGTLPAGQAGQVFVTVRTGSTGPLATAGAGDQFNFAFDPVGNAIAVVNVDPGVTLHVGAASTLVPGDFQVIGPSFPSFNQITIKYVGQAGKSWAAGETMSVHATLMPQVAGAFAAGVTYAGTLHAASPANGDTISFIDFAIGPAPKICSLDVDGNGAQDALTDGLLILRAMFGLTGTAVTNGAVGSGASRADWTALRAYLNGNCGANFPP